MKVTKLWRFNKTTPHFSAFRASSSPIVCWWLWKEPVCWWWDEDADVEMDRVTADARSDHHWQPQPCRQSIAWWSSPTPCWCVLVTALRFFCRWSVGRLIFTDQREIWHSGGDWTVGQLCRPKFHANPWIVSLRGDKHQNCWKPREKRRVLLLFANKNAAISATAELLF